MTSHYIRWFEELRTQDVGLVGGKNASLGEMVGRLKGAGIRVPDGFALSNHGLTAQRRLLLRRFLRCSPSSTRCSVVTKATT